MAGSPIKQFGYTCRCCGQYHEGMPSFGWDYPSHYFAVPEEEREQRVEHCEDACVIDGQWFYVLGRVLIPVHGYDEPLVWLMWVSLSKQSFQRYLELIEARGREQEPPFFGWVPDIPPVYPASSHSLKSHVHLQPFPTRPSIELEPTDHPFALDQRQGISPERVEEIATALLHRKD